VPEHVLRTVLILGIALGLTCCATSRGAQQVQEVEPGTYSIGINRGSTTLFSSSDKNTIDEAVDKAGEYCHSKGQKLSVKTAAGSSLVFHCVPDDSKSADKDGGGAATKPAPPSAQ
jgi:putative hemolysin